jgi:hypothetical protein
MSQFRNPESFCSEHYFTVYRNHPGRYGQCHFKSEPIKKKLKDASMEGKAFVRRTFTIILCCPNKESLDVCPNYRYTLFFKKA